MYHSFKYRNIMEIIWCHIYFRLMPKLLMNKELNVWEKFKFDEKTLYRSWNNIFNWSCENLLMLTQSNTFLEQIICWHILQMFVCTITQEKITVMHQRTSLTHRTVQCKVHSFKYKLQNVHCTLHNVQCKVYSLKCTLYS